MRSHTASAVLIASLMSGCVAPPPPNPQSLVPVDVIINTIKCEVAQLVSDKALQTPRRMVVAGQDFAVTLKLKAVVAVSGGLDAEGGLSVLAYNGIVPGVTLGVSGTSTSTVDTTTSFTLNGTVLNDEACKQDIKEQSVLQNGIGYYTYMQGFGNDLNKFADGDPKIIAEEFTYDATFGVSKKFEGSIKYGFVPLAVKGSAAASKDNVQQIIIAVKNRKDGDNGATVQSLPGCANNSCLPGAKPMENKPPNY